MWFLKLSPMGKVVSKSPYKKKRTVRAEPLKKELLYKIKGRVRFPERVAIVGNEKT